MNKFVSFLDKQASDLRIELASRNAASIAKQVESNTPDFTHLELHSESNILPAGMELIVSVLPLNHYITHVSIKSRPVAGTSVVHKIAEFARLTTCLTHLRMADVKDVDSAAAEALFHSLANNISVQQLAMPGCQLSCSAALAFLLQNNFTIQAMDFSRNNFGSDFAPILKAFNKVPSGALKAIYLTENNISSDDGNKLISTLEQNPKSATAVTYIQVELLEHGGVEPPLQKALCDLLYMRAHGEPRPAAPPTTAATSIDETVNKAMDKLSAVASRARGASFQKTPAAAADSGATSSSSSQPQVTEKAPSPQQQSDERPPPPPVITVTTAPPPPTATEDRSCQTTAAPRRDAGLQVHLMSPSHGARAEIEESVVAPAASSDVFELEQQRVQIFEQQKDIQRLREEVATEQMARAALAETLQYELECERANSARLSAENEATFMELQKQQSVVVQLDQTSRSIIAELRDVCAEAYVRLDAALTAVEHEREQLIRQQRQSYKMVAAMRATRAELDALLERNSSDVARSLSEALLLLSSSRTHSSTITRDAGCVTDLTIAELEAYRLRRQEKHEVRRKARRIQHMEEMRKRGAGPVDHYAVTLEGELAALERRARLAQQAALTAATTGSSPQQIPTSPKGSVASTTTSTSATKRGPPASDAGVDDDMSMVLIDADDEDLVDPAFQQMTEDRWMDEKLVSDCCGCEKPFRLLKRKHHCRRCGCVFCDKCCPVSNLHKIRICVQCLHPEAKYSVPPPSTRGSVSSRR